MIIGHTLFKLNFRRHLWKGNLAINMKLPKLEIFLEELQRSQKAVKKSIETAKKTKKQFDKKRRNPQGLKTGDKVQLEAKNIYSNRPSKKLDQKRYRPFKIAKDIS